MTDHPLADGVRWHFPGRSRIAGDFEGRDAVDAHLAEHAGLAHSEEVAVVGDDTFSVAIVRVTAERNGKAYNRHDVVVSRIKEGKVAEGWHYPESQYEWDDLLA